MIIKSVVIHEVIKKSKSTEADVYISEELLDVNDSKIKRIVSLLDESFSKRSLRRSRFSEDGFKEDIDSFKNYSILDISRKLTRKLKNNIKGIPQAKGGYLIFTEFESRNNFLAIFLVRNTDGTKLKQSGKSWDLDSTLYLDVEHFAMGAKINLSLLNDGSEERYISMVKGNTDISQYFENWIGVDDTKKENIDADALYDIANHIDLPDNIENRDVLKKQYLIMQKHIQQEL